MKNDGETDRLLEQDCPDVKTQVSQQRCRRYVALCTATAAVSLAIGFLAKQFGMTFSPRFQTSQLPFRLYEGQLPMPEKSSQYDGIEDKRIIDVTPNRRGEVHVFAIGDWGAPIGDHKTFAAKPAEQGAQFWVAGEMKGRAAWANPQYVLNAGDNFYVAGIDGDCNQPPRAAWGTAQNEFNAGWGWIYGDLSHKPWISALGNHDFGGWQMNRGWPLQIGYSFINHNWIMPARYFSKTVSHGDYDVQYFILDSNAWDAKDPNDASFDQKHNICSWRNPQGAHCGGNDGPTDIWNCKDWFWSSFAEQKAWLTDKVKNSRALWKVVVTHFPCGYDADLYRGLHEHHGLNLLVTGHRHQQELWWPGTVASYVRDFLNKNNLGDLTCFVTGGGGGIRAEEFGGADYGNDVSWYGFFDLTFSKRYLNVELVNSDGRVFGNRTIHASPSQINQIHAEEVAKKVQNDSDHDFEVKNDEVGSPAALEENGHNEVSTNGLVDAIYRLSVELGKGSTGTTPKRGHESEMRKGTPDADRAVDKLPDVYDLNSKTRPL